MRFMQFCALHIYPTLYCVQCSHTNFHFSPRGNVEYVYNIIATWHNYILVSSATACFTKLLLKFILLLLLTLLLKYAVPYAMAVIGNTVETIIRIRASVPPGKSIVAFRWPTGTWNHCEYDNISLFAFLVQNLNLNRISCRKKN